MGAEAISGMSDAEREGWRVLHVEADEAMEAAKALQLRAAGVLAAADIFAPLPPVNWMCQALDVAPGAPLLIAGYGFSGKTVSAQDLALAVATGTAAWGAFPVRAGRVLHLDFEQGAHLTRWRYQRLVRARGIDPAALDDRLALAVMPGWYVDADTRDDLARMSDGFDVVILDSFRAACPHTDENSSEARIPLDRLTRISERTGTTFAVIHHARKPSQNAQGGARMAIRGSGALFDACGSVIVFSAEKGEPVTVAHEKARISGRLHPDFRLWIEDVDVDGDPTAGLRVTCLADAPSGAQASPSDRFEEAKRLVLALVREEGETGGVNVVASRLGRRKTDVSAAVDELVRLGLIRKGGTYKAPILTYAGTDHDSE